METFHDQFRLFGLQKLFLETFQDPGLTLLFGGKRIVETFHNPFLNSLRKKHTRKNGLLNISTICFCEMPLFLDIAQKTDCGNFPQSVSQFLYVNLFRFIHYCIQARSYMIFSKFQNSSTKTNNQQTKPNNNTPHNQEMLWTRASR